MCGNDELAAGSDPGQSRQEPLLFRWMQVQLQLINQHNRSFDVESNKLVNQREDCLFS